MNIHQLSVTYQLDHDRILVQINTHAAEILRLWLTRRMALKLLPHLNQIATKVEASNLLISSQDDDAQRMVMEFKKQASISQSDFNTPFDDKASAFPIGPEPLLVTKVNLLPTGNGTLNVGFEEFITGTAEPRGFQISMASSLLHNFMHLLESAVKSAQWGVEQAAAQATDPNTHPPALPPTYLN